MGQSWLQKYSTYEEEIHGSTTAITAFAGGGQASATALTTKFNRVDTAAAANASVKLAAAKVGKRQIVFNNTAKLIAIFPQSSEYIDGYLNGTDTNTPLYVSTALPGEVVYFECFQDGYWTSVKDGRSQIFSKKVVVAQADVQTSNGTPVVIIPAITGKVIEVISCLRGTTSGAYSGNTTGHITSDITDAEQPWHSFDYDVTFNGYKKCLENSNGAYAANSLAVYFLTATGNPTGAGGSITFYITYRVFTA